MVSYMKAIGRLPYSREVIAMQLYDATGKRTLYTCSYPVEAIAKQLYDVIGKRYIYKIYIVIYNTISRYCKVHVLILCRLNLEK